MIKLLVTILFVTSGTWCLQSGSALIEDETFFGEHIEGDMILNKEQLAAISTSERNGLIDTKYRWPNKTIPYLLTQDHNEEQRNYIETALKVIETVSCVRFVRRTNEKAYVRLAAGDGGCYAMVGYQGRPQVLNLKKFEPGLGCFRLGAIVHEFLHALGFYHMQSAYDRDDYVKILWENITPGTENNFNKYSSSVITYFNTSYDYLSVMHYPAYGFSNNGKPTIVPRDEKYLDIIGRLMRLSVGDIKRLNSMYECE